MKKHNRNLDLKKKELSWDEFLDGLLDIREFIEIHFFNENHKKLTGKPLHELNSFKRIKNYQSSVIYCLPDKILLPGIDFKNTSKVIHESIVRLSNLEIDDKSIAALFNEILVLRRLRDLAPITNKNLVELQLRITWLAGLLFGFYKHKQLMLDEKSAKGRTRPTQKNKTSKQKEVIEKALISLKITSTNQFRSDKTLNDKFLKFVRDNGVLESHLGGIGENQIKGIARELLKLEKLDKNPLIADVQRRIASSQNKSGRRRAISDS